MCLLELMASPEVHARIAAWGVRGMQLELVEVQGTAAQAGVYRRSGPKEEWTTSVVRGEQQSQTFTAVALWPPVATQEVHLAAVGVAERELQAVARTLYPALIDALFAARKWQAGTGGGGGVGVAHGSCHGSGRCRPRPCSMLLHAGRGHGGRPAFVPASSDEINFPPPPPPLPSVCMRDLHTCLTRQT